MAQIPTINIGPEDGGNFEFPWTGNVLKAHFLSDIGRKRKHNEDSCVISVPDLHTGTEQALFAVADGMGGAQAGEFASRLSLQILAEEYFPQRVDNVPVALKQVVNEANSRVYEEAESNPDLQGMGTTLSTLVIKGDNAYIAQVGDSRVYLVRESSPIHQITEDHSLVAEQLRSGFITEEEAKNHSLKNLITRAIGIRDDVCIDLFGLKIQKGDTFLICSDGLCNMVEDNEIEAAMLKDNLQGVARILVGQALENGGTDNVTVALVRVTGTPEKMPFDKGATEVCAPKSGFFGKLRTLFGG